MTTTAIDFGIRVYMNQYDVTPWINHWEIEQGDEIPTKFRLDFMSWSGVELDAQWDIYGSYNPVSAPRDSVILYKGVIPPDQREFFTMRRGGLPVYRIEGCSYVYLATRKKPQRTVLVMPTVGVRGIVSARAALQAQAGEPIGLMTYWTGMRTNRQAINHLARRAGMNVSCNLPEYPIGPFMIKPGETYWSAIRALVDPWQPYVWHCSANNVLYISDCLDSIMGVGTEMNIPPSIVEAMTIRPSKSQRPSRVIVRVPQWR